jgi:hypothetical protein
MESGLTNPPALIGTGEAKGVTSLRDPWEEKSGSYWEVAWALACDRADILRIQAAAEVLLSQAAFTQW